ncbi:MAG: hypothetical protein OQK13_05910 [Gammaproteobacteria bacterium]|nr:hypothetical protein [Gammaproteobacteria bacterium]
MLSLNTGLNLQHVFNFDELPPDLISNLEGLGYELAPYRQLILIGHGGRALWEAMNHSGIISDDPIDDFTIGEIEQSFANAHHEHHYQIIYPGDQPLSLQQLGSLAGWHHPSPFMVGINSEWGSWYAYRAVVLADSHFEPTQPVASESPCETCGSRLCVDSCPGGALEDGFELQRCVGYRKLKGSNCKDRCLARMSCPVAPQHRYSEEQIRYHYSISMRMIETLY